MHSALATVVMVQLSLFLSMPQLIDAFLGNGRVHGCMYAGLWQTKRLDIV